MAVSHHPHPLLERHHWRDLNGVWHFAHDDLGAYHHPGQVNFDREIRVPYPPESPASGIHDTDFHPIVWYSRRIQLEPNERPLAGETRLLLHFGAVDYRARVWVNGEFVTEHEGGQTPFSADITHLALASDHLEIIVRAEDDPHDLTQPRGKQDWRRDPHAIWYPRTTGIWQTVWLEVVPETRIERLHWTPDGERWEIKLEASVAGRIAGHLALRVRLTSRGQELVNDVYGLKGRHLTRRIAINDPGIGDERNFLLWSPEHPNLIQAELELLEGSSVIDRVSSYTAMRTVGSHGQRFVLNGHAYPLRMVLDQGYWPESLMAASDEELRADVELTKRLGFNGARKHQKLESPRWLYWCDVLGLLVWEEMPSHYAFSPQAVQRLTREWTVAIERDRSHPCIVGWVPFNESWGVPDLATNTVQQEYVRSIYHLTKTLDPTRLCVGNDGWEFVVGDWVGIHDYAHDPKLLEARYGTPEAIEVSIRRPWGHVLVVDGATPSGPRLLSEFGGIAFSSAAGSWGYSRAHDEPGFLEHYASLLAAAHHSSGLAGFCYTQLTDTFQERNGLLTEHREPKADLARIAAATRGERSTHEAEIEGEANPLGYSRRWFLQANGASAEPNPSASND